MTMKKQLKVSGLLIFLLFLTAVLALYYSLVYTGLSQKTAQLSAQHLSNTQQLSAYQEMLVNKSALQQSVGDLKEKVRNSASGLGVPASGLSDDIIKGLKSAGVSATGITMSDASAGKKTSSGRTMTQITVSITADCTEPQLVTLLHYFERGTSAVYSVNSVNTNAKTQQGKTASGQYGVTLNMTAYYLAAASSKAAS
jgi:hypothetical protein